MNNATLVVRCKKACEYLVQEGSFLESLMLRIEGFLLSADECPWCIQTLETVDASKASGTGIAPVPRPSSPYMDSIASFLTSPVTCPV
jgi:hypothetical protein